MRSRDAFEITMLIYLSACNVLNYVPSNLWYFKEFNAWSEYKYIIRRKYFGSGKLKCKWNLLCDESKKIRLKSTITTFQIAKTCILFKFWTSCETFFILCWT